MTEPGLNRVVLILCDLCIAGAGGECHVPGCTLWMRPAPDISIRDAIESLEPLPYEPVSVASPKGRPS